MTQDSGDVYGLVDERFTDVHNLLVRSLPNMAVLSWSMLTIARTHAQEYLFW